MRRFVVGGVFVQVTILLVGLFWIAPIAEGDGGGSASATAAGDPATFSTLGAGSGEIVEVELDAVETVMRLGPDVRYQAWTFGGTAPGPVIRVTQGDTVRFTLNNESALGLSHSIDFHAAQTPWDVNYQPVAPGESLTFDWVARYPGVFMYHCGVPPVLHHIANGMYGAIVVEPAEPLPPAREYVLVASEFYPGEGDGILEGDPTAMEAGDPEYVVFNGGIDRYLEEPLVARPGERIRLWVMNAGPTLRTAFHVIGALFDTVSPDGNPANALHGIQTWDVPPGGGARFELTVPDAGLYPFVTHSFAYAGRGSTGVLKVDPSVPPMPADYPTIADPFDGGLTEISGSVDGGSQTPPAPESESGAEGGEDGGSEPAHGGTTTLELEATITAFSPADLEATEGEVELTYVNGDPMPHDFTIDELDVAEAIDSSATETFTFQARPGTYAFYCSIPGHLESGMEGTLTVLPAEGH